MTKFNILGTFMTKNRSGFPAYQMDDQERLLTAVLATMVSEPKFYGSTDSDIVSLARAMAGTDPDFLAKLAVYARKEADLRSVSHLLTAVVARFAPAYTRAVIRSAVVRPDDITEIMACYKSMYGLPFPNAMKREIASMIQNFSEYQLAKYNGGQKSITFRDVLRITHPVPKDEETAVLLGKVVHDTLETPYTWETELSARGNNKEVWDELIASGDVGYMALLRNLRNIVKSGADVAPVLKVLSDPERVRKSRQLPFRFYSAYRTLASEDLLTAEILDALEKAIDVSTGNIETLAGRTLIAVDVSGSMGTAVSAKSGVRCCDIAALFAAMANRICEDAVIVCFDAADHWSCNGPSGYSVKRFGKYDSVLASAKSMAFAGGRTDLSLPMEYALKKDLSRNLHPFDRVIYLSDNECNRSLNGTPMELLEEYRAKYSEDLWVHAVDLQGYGTQQFKGRHFNLIAGWSDQVLPFIALAEKGFGTMVEAVADYKLS